MLSNAYFLAKFRFDTAENEPAKNLQKICTKFANFAKFANCPGRRVGGDRDGPHRAGRGGAGGRRCCLLRCGAVPVKALMR